VVVRKTRKHRKFRGHRTYHGSHKKWRGGGNRGGRGKAGMHKHKWSYAVKYATDTFGKHGFTRSPAVTEDSRIINLNELNKILNELLEKKLAEKEADKIKISLPKIGYEKLLGTGKVDKPLIVEAKAFSKLAIKKLEEAGGRAVKV